MAPSNFNCDSCKQGIAPSDPRVHCIVCPDYDLCAICALGERFSDSHHGVHKTQVYKVSGGNGQTSIPATQYSPESAPIASPPIASPSTSTDIPRGATAPAIPPPLPPRLPPRRGNTTQRTSLPSSPTPSHPAHQQTPTEWAPFFNADSSPTPGFIDLINDIFSFLDPTNLGNLVPETISGFLDDMGYLPHENAWKLGLKATFGLSAESMADKSLKNVYDLFSIDHILLKRVQPAHVDPTGLTSQFSRILGSAFNPSLLANPANAHSTMEGPMPAITRNGFLELRRIEGLSDPSREWGNLSRLLKKYNLPKYATWGDLPRSVLPEVPDPAMLQRIAGVTAFAQRKAQEELAAARVSAQIQADGRQAAIDLVSDTRREYRYY